jgi:hypothetical protein
MSAGSGGGPWGRAGGTAADAAAEALGGAVIWDVGVADATGETLEEEPHARAVIEIPARIAARISDDGGTPYC